MSRDDDRAGDDAPAARDGPGPGPDAAAPIALSDREQTRNVLIYAANWALIYLSSPITYVGLVQASLIDRLGFGAAEANLPASAYLWAFPMAAVVTWRFPRVRQLKPLLIAALLSNAVVAGLVAASVLWLDARAVLAALVVHAAAWGCGNGVFFSCQWEMLGRGVDPARRGQALGLAFGAGPVLAVVASLGSQAVLGGKAQQRLPFAPPEVPYPWNFAALYLAAIPVLVLAALQSSLYVVPSPAVEVERRPFVEGIFGGIREYVGSRLIRLAALGYILSYAGHEILQNMGLYTQFALGESPERYAGLQLTLRFGFKIAAGFALGWLLARTNPRFLMLTTTSVMMASILWAMTVTGPWFLVGFGIMGAGELFGVYYPNYIVDCSPRAHLRRNMAFTGMLMLLVGFAPVCFGWLSQAFGEAHRRAGLRLSFVAALGVLALALLLVRLALPARPTVESSPS